MDQAASRVSTLGDGAQSLLEKSYVEPLFSQLEPDGDIAP